MLTEVLNSTQYHLQIVLVFKWGLPGVCKVVTKEHNCFLYESDWLFVAETSRTKYQVNTFGREMSSSQCAYLLPNDDNNANGLTTQHRPSSGAATKPEVF